MQFRQVVLVALSPVVTACALDLGVSEQELVSCPNWACAQNNAKLNNRPFHELAENGTVNAEGFRLGPMVKNGVAYQVRVSGTRLLGVNDGGSIGGAALVGAYFYVVDTKVPQAIRVNINAVTPVPVWAGPQEGMMLESYRLEWSDPVSDRVLNLCSNPPVEKHLSSELLGQKGETTLVFENVRYDAAKKEVLAGDRNWFNITCAGHALSKLLLTGQNQNTGNATVAAQQAALKALTADYCGNGTPFTVGGEPLYWKTSNGDMAYFGIATTLEARWTDKGAMCLGQPRLKVSKLSVAQATFPDIHQAITDHCGASKPPECIDVDPATFAGALVVTANPFGE